MGKFNIILIGNVVILSIIIYWYIQKVKRYKVNISILIIICIKSIIIIFLLESKITVILALIIENQFIILYGNLYIC